LNDYLLSVVLGIIEGLTEYLPVSSTAHLRIAEALFHLSLSDGYWKMYTIVIQLGAILCLPVYFRDRIAKLLSTFPRGESGDRTILNHPLSLVLVAFVVTAIPSFLLTKVIGKHLESMPIIGWSLLIGAVVMWIVDAAKAKSEAAGPGAPSSSIRTWKMDAMSLGQAVWIGFCQIFSGLFPGTSRSMSTIAGGQLAGMSRASALFHSHHGRSYRLHTIQVGPGERRESDRSFADDFESMGAAGDRLRGFFPGRLCVGRVVHGLGEEARVCAVRGISQGRLSAVQPSEARPSL
jgi:undecaprenyl-diphosphatase UppP